MVWLRDSKGHSIYFAHLQKQIAKSRTYVNPGDTIGTVGNTGNAKNTPTHLHFGIYRRGPIDPINFIKETNTELPNITANLESLGNWGRTKKTTFLRYPEVSAAVIDTLAEHQPMKVIGAVKSSYRVELPNGAIGYIEASNIESTLEPIASRTALAPRALTVQNLEC